MKFTKKLQHDLRKSLVGITSLSQVLDEVYGKLSEHQKKESLKIIGNSAEKLNNLITTVLDLFRISKIKDDSEFKNVSLTNLVYKQAEKCKNLYIQDAKNKSPNLILDLENNIIIHCHEYYFGRAIESIIVNAINYSSKQNIYITLLKKSDNEIQFYVIGKNVKPPEEEYSIVGDFNTRKVEDNIEIILAQRVAELHEEKFFIEKIDNTNLKIGISITKAISLKALS